MYSTNPSDFFLILMDVDMPVMNGNASAAKIRGFERRQQLHKTNIVALTGVTSAEAERECYESGMDQFFTKPMSLKKLSAVIVEIQGRTD